MRRCGGVFEQVTFKPSSLRGYITHGAASQNRAGVPDFRAHLAGRVSWVSMVAPARGAKLAALLQRIRW